MIEALHHFYHFFSNPLIPIPRKAESSYNKDLICLNKITVLHNTALFRKSKVSPGWATEVKPLYTTSAPSVAQWNSVQMNVCTAAFKADPEVAVKFIWNCTRLLYFANALFFFQKKKIYIILKASIFTGHKKNNSDFPKFCKKCQIIFKLICLMVLILHFAGQQKGSDPKHRFVSSSSQNISPLQLFILHNKFGMHLLRLSISLEDSADDANAGL